MTGAVAFPVYQYADCVWILFLAAPEEGLAAWLGADSLEEGSPESAGFCGTVFKGGGGFDGDDGYLGGHIEWLGVIEWELRADMKREWLKSAQRDINKESSTICTRYSMRKDVEAQSIDNRSC